MIMSLEWICPKCGKTIVSSSKSQEEYNVEQHLEKHKRKEDARKKRKNK